MENLFDIETGTISAFAADKVTDSTKTWVVDQFKGWYCVVGSTEYEITSNTETELLFSNAISTLVSYQIWFVKRDKLTEIESDASDTVKVTDALIEKKYKLANVDLNLKIYAKFRHLITSEFNPLENIKNLYILKQVFGYYLLAKIYQDLSIDQDSFEAFKGYNQYEKLFNDNIRDAISVLQIDLDQSGDIDSCEKAKAPSTMSYFTR